MSETKKGPLHGLTIIDLTRVLSGPFGMSWMGDMGATIIKVENPIGGDATRNDRPFINGTSNYFATINRNKKCVTLNLKDPKGKEMFLELVKQADVVTENFRPGTMEKLGLGYEELSKVNEQIILASISGYGQTGPYAHRPGYDAVSQAMGGIMSLTGFPGNPPTKCGTSIGDVAAGMNMVIGILAALYRVQTTGKGERIEVALVDSVLSLITQDYIEYAHSKKLPVLLGNNYSLWCPYGTYKAKDRYYTIAVGTQEQWRKLCTAILGQPELGDDPRYESQAARVEHRAEVDALINAWAENLTAKEAVEQLNQASVPAALLYNFADIEEDENFTVHRQMIKHMEHPIIGDIPYINMPIRFQESGLVEPKAAGSLGQFNEEIYEQYLGLNKDELEELKANGTI